MRISDWSSDVCSSDLACGGHENMLRPLRLKELCDGRTIGEIQFTVCARNDVGKAGPLQGAENCAADETAMTRHIDFVVDTHCETRLRVDLNSDPRIWRTRPALKFFLFQGRAVPYAPSSDRKSTRLNSSH